MQVLLGGGSGLVGRALARSLRADGHGVRTLVRREPRSENEVRWDARTPPAAEALAGIDAVVHLGGASIADKPWSAARKRVLRDSRIDSTAALASALADAAARGGGPHTFVVASAIGYYGDRGDEAVTEDSSRGSGFLADLVADWEAAAEPARAAGVRTLSVRLGLVLSREGGLLAKLSPSFRFALGARLGDGRQWMSWITRTDTVRLLRFVLEHPTLDGAVNGVAEAATNADFTRELGRAVGRPAPWVAPAWLLKLAAGDLAREALLSGQRVSSSRLSRAGFTFEETDLAEALRART